MCLRGCGLAYRQICDQVQQVAGESCKLQLEMPTCNMVTGQRSAWIPISMIIMIWWSQETVFSRLTDDLVPQDIVVTKTDRGNSSGFSHCHLSLNAAHLNFLQTRPHCFLSWTCSLTMFTQRLPLVTTKFSTRVFFICLFLLPPTYQLLWSNPGSSRCYTCASSAHWPSVAAPPMKTGPQLRPGVAQPGRGPALQTHDPHAA